MIMMRYSALRGLPIRSSDGATIGRLADLVVERSGDEAVCCALVAAPNLLLVAFSRLGHRPRLWDGHPGLWRIDAAEVAHMDPTQVRLRGPRSRYGRR